MVKQQETASSDSPSSTGSKRKRPEEPIQDLAGSALRKKPRNRVRNSFSCGECHRRKQKCDRQVPCGHCVSRKVPELCKAYTPGKSEQDLNMRLSRIEQIIETAFPQIAQNVVSMNGDERGNRSPSSDPGEIDDDEVPDGRLQSGAWHGVSAIGSVSSAPIIEQLQSMVPHQSLTSETQIKDSISHLARLSSCSKDLALAAEHLNAARSGDPASLLAATKIIDAVRQFADENNGGGLNPNGAVGLAFPTVFEDMSAADKFKSLIQDCGVSPHKVSELLQELPSKRHTDALVDFYFTAVNYTRYPLNEKEFRGSYEGIRCSDGIGINPNDIKFLPLLFIVLAIAARVAPVSLTGDDKQRRLTSLRYYWSSRRSVTFAAAIHNDSFELVWVRLLSARFLTFDRRITETWSQLGAAVRTAQALGLHRDGRKMGLDFVQTQKRRRLWAYVYHADRSFALVMGRPQCIMDDYTSTLPPMNIDDEELLANPDNPPEYPLSHITPVTFVILRHQLATIIGRICHHFQQVRHKPHYSEVLALDDDLTRFTLSLPTPFSLNPDTSISEERPYVPIHRFLVLTEIMFVRMSLHRPYILRRLDSDRFAKSRRACFDAAKKDFAVRSEFRLRMSRENLTGIGVAYREFQTAMISGIALMLDPQGPDADDMKVIVDTFLSDHRNQPDLDDTTKRELKIIEFLKIKSQETRLPVDASDGSDTQQGGAEAGENRSDDNNSSFVTRDSNRGSPRIASSLPLSSMRLTPLPGMVNHPSHQSNISAASHFSPVPTPLMTRLQHSDTALESPPPTSASPGDDGSGAQSLLDHWCDTVSNAPPPDLFRSLSPSIAPWAGSVDFSESIGSIPMLNHGDSTGNDSLEADLNYWETMFNMIPQSTAVTSGRGI